MTLPATFCGFCEVEKFGADGHAVHRCRVIVDFKPDAVVDNDEIDDAGGFGCACPIGDGQHAFAAHRRKDFRILALVETGDKKNLAARPLADAFQALDRDWPVVDALALNNFLQDTAEGIFPDDAYRGRTGVRLKRVIGPRDETAELINVGRFYGVLEAFTGGGRKRRRMRPARCGEENRQNARPPPTGKVVFQGKAARRVSMDGDA